MRVGEFVENKDIAQAGYDDIVDIRQIHIGDSKDPMTNIRMYDVEKILNPITRALSYYSSTAVTSRVMEEERRRREMLEEYGRRYMSKYDFLSILSLDEYEDDMHAKAAKEATRLMAENCYLKTLKESMSSTAMSLLFAQRYVFDKDWVIKVDEPSTHDVLSIQYDDIVGFDEIEDCQDG